MNLEESLEQILRKVIREELHGAPLDEIEKLLTADQVGDLLDCDRQGVYRLKREGHLTAVYVSETSFKFAPDEVRRFIREQGTKHIASDTGTGLQCASEATQ